MGARPTYNVTDLWSGTITSATGALSVTLDAGFGRLFELQQHRLRLGWSHRDRSNSYQRRKETNAPELAE